MLKNSLYKIQQVSTGNNLIEATIELNDAHEIFKGHFPSKPILPGVCTLQMIKDILQESLNAQMQLRKANEIKFLQIIEPTLNKQLKVQLQYKADSENFIVVNAKVSKPDETICCKIKAAFIIKK